MVIHMAADNTRIYTILYVEDNAANRQLVEMIIERRSDLTLITAADGRTGLQLAAEQKPDLILLDNSLPDINGHEVLAQLKASEHTREIPVVSLSGGTALSPPDETEAQLFTAYLAKPIDIRKFYAAIDQTLHI